MNKCFEIYAVINANLEEAGHFQSRDAEQTTIFM